MIKGAGRRSRWLSWRLAAVFLAVAAGGAVILIGLAVFRSASLDLARATDVSTIVLDRHGQLLRAFTTKDGRWRLGADPAKIDPRYLAMLLAFEDKRFYGHSGVDVLALGRASWQFARHGRIVSGASTLTMQLARLLDGGHERSAFAKFNQISRAFALERRFSKREILRLYLELAPMGGNIEGVRAAALAYFGREPERLSVGEAALLVALPQSPEARRPDRASEAARRARDRVLDRAVAAGVILEADARRAKDEPVAKTRRDFLALAPHLAEAEAARWPDEKVHRLTLDRDLQEAFEALALEQAKFLGRKLSAAILAADNQTGEVLAYVGSAGFLERERLGAVDMVAAVRSPGSALKPFIYGLAFEAGLAHPETLIEDRPIRFGAYRPKNFDEGYRGAVTMREALSHSLNIPAVKILNAVGPARLAGRFRRAGVTLVLPPGASPSLAVALGGTGVRMLDLVGLYAGLARGGQPVALSWRRDAKPEPARRRMASRRLLSPAAAWYVTDILKDAPPPPAAIGGRIAYKTGTSYGYRDAWAIGYDGRHTIAVWVGRADGTGTPGLLGRTAAAPILFDAFARLGGKRAPLAGPPRAVIAADGAALPPPLKRFHGDVEEAAFGPFLEPGVTIAFPPDRSEMEAGDAAEPLPLKAEGGVLPLTWLIDDAPVPSDPHRREAAWTPAGRGFFKLSVIDAKGRIDRAVVRLK